MGTVPDIDVFWNMHVGLGSSFPALTGPLQQLRERMQKADKDVLYSQILQKL